jgi:photosystem II stability/assembly factor-like uncharacterized protein
MARTADGGQVLVAIGTRKGLWLARSSDRQDWQVSGPHLPMVEIPSVAIDTRAGHRVLVGARSEHWGPTVQRSDDLGATWHEPEGGAMVFPADTGAALERVWQIAPDPGRPGVVWAGAEPTSLWRSEDGGESFSLVRGLWDHPHRPQWFPGQGGAAVHTVLADPVDDQRVVVAMSTGGVYVSEDGGTSWTPANRGIRADFMPEPEPEFGQCVHKVARDAADPRVMYAQNHGGVFRTDDGGKRWVSIADGLPADFGFVMLAHPRTGGTAWVVPLTADRERLPPGGKLQVHRTRDGGRTWQPNASGLPDQSWNTVLRDAAAVDDADPVGVYIGARDGTVYASADEGETFTVVTEHLPDVLSVRAARVPAGS